MSVFRVAGSRPATMTPTQSDDCKLTGLPQEAGSTGPRR